MFCQNCGTKNDDDAVFCQNCGAHLQQEGVAGAPPNIGSVQSHKRISKVTWAILAEIIALVLAGYGVAAIGRNAFTAEHAAETFFVHMANRNWDAAYKMLDTDESEFINAQMYAQANQGSGIGTVSNYHVVKNDALGNTSGGWPGYTVEIAYRLRGVASEDIYELSLIKQLDKKYLFFSDWKIGITTNLIYPYYQIIVPNGASVVLDGIELDDEYLDLDSMAYDSEMAHYVIPRIFLGNHTITVSMEYKEDVTEQFTIDRYSGGYYVWDMYWTQETMEELAHKAEEYLDLIYSAEVNGDEFDSISDIFSSDTGYGEDFAYSYEGLRNSIHSDTLKILTLAFYDVSAEMLPNGDWVTVSFSYDAGYLYRDWWSGEMQYEEYHRGQGVLSCRLVLEDGKWVLANFPAEYLYL